MHPVSHDSHTGYVLPTSAQLMRSGGYAVSMRPSAYDLWHDCLDATGRVLGHVDTPVRSARR